MIGSLLVKLSMDSAEFDAGSKKVQKSAQTLSSALGDMAKVAGGIMLDRAISGIVSFGKEAFESAGRIVDLSEKTGLSIKAVQQFGFIAEQSGSSVESMAQATFKLGVNIEKGGKEVDAALKAIGLSLAEVQRLKPEEQFDLIARKLSALPDIQQRNAVGVALMGKGYSEAAAPIAHYTELIDKATVSTDASVRALDDAGDAWDGFLNSVSAKSRNVLGQAVLDAQEAVSGWSKFFGEIKAFATGSAKSHREYVESLQALEKQAEKNTEQEKARVKSLSEIKAAEEAKTKALEKARKEQEAYNDEIAKYVGLLRGDDLARKVKLLEEAYKRLTPEQLANRDVMKRLTEEAVKLADAGATLPPKLDAIARSGQAVRAALELAKITTTDFGKALQGLGKEIDLVDPKFFKLEAMLAGATDGGQEVIDKLKALGTEVTLLPAPPTDGWLFFRDYATAVISDISGAMAMGLTDMIAGNVSFSEGLKGIWQGIKSILLSILDDILHYFINSFLQGMLRAAMGTNLGGAIIGSIFGGGGGIVGGGGGGLLGGLFGGGATAGGIGLGGSTAVTLPSAGPAVAGAASGGGGIGGGLLAGLGTAAAFALPIGLYFGLTAGHEPNEGWYDYQDAQKNKPPSFYESQEYKDWAAANPNVGDATDGIMSAIPQGSFLSDAEANQWGTGVTPSTGMDLRQVDTRYIGGIGGLMPDAGDFPSYASGTNGFVDFGAGTLAMLHGREAVVPEAAVMDANSMGGEMRIVFAPDGRSMAEWLIEYIPGAARRLGLSGVY